MTFVKVYGIQRSGTNLLERLLERNFKCRNLVHCLGWKHGPKRDYAKMLDHYIQRSDKHIVSFNKDVLARIIRQNDVRAIAISKHPYAWIVSASKYVETRTSLQNMDGIKKMVERYNNLYKNWIENGIPTVQYEKILERPKITIISIGEKLGLERRSDKFVRVDNHVGPHPNGTRNFAEHADFYLKTKPYMRELTAGAINVIDRQINRGMVAKLGYSMGSDA